ncbi:MAG: hypothetical protein UR28_C0003G0055 [Candidatus Peregrinibacteria bacterium GW2011_GWF2_33_10]|nr:MAG: hypothetical protein UR28_C0003G0055 [Candidatus Peregrinibacteria bacterium GW2011_GWF2_33_10]OGJ44206.1 MAG: hypothetical protein A2263_04495 [Candidatus Peregrinibacteria bacterium RIFOXYA2_FULL_33_21]OGJ46690.1 MAG: hypothetical protein A2272_04755 [Candidatus Peregrinibacteria bacterium RIFOXYA12_FULL_33_12]OGJ51835.1 MAG: hypothetical protein A2307_05160 [Candidatus Peregrinibacteria bacterium RIFOXYB2_FULL_33_20]
MEEISQKDLQGIQQALSAGGIHVRKNVSIEGLGEDGYFKTDKGYWSVGKDELTRLNLTKPCDIFYDQTGRLLAVQQGELLIADPYRIGIAQATRLDIRKMI